MVIFSNWYITPSATSSSTLSTRPSRVLQVSPTGVYMGGPLLDTNEQQLTRSTLLCSHDSAAKIEAH